ncbi:MAG: serine hydrolase [Desulfobacterales bacterium]|jgi:beta-lactamase class A
MDCFKRVLALIFFVLICAGLTGAQSQDDSWTQSCDPRLQKALEKRINALKLDGATEHKNLSIVVVDITDVSDPRMAYVNPNEMMYAASLPKIAILLGAFEKIAAGEMILDDDTLEKLKQMIRRSSNSAASEMLDRVGIDYLADLLQSPRYRLYDPAHRRDPLHNLSHGATALQVARFYYLLETGQLVSPQLSELMKAILAETEIEHKFVKGLRSVQPDSEIYRKSGTWGPYHSDSAIIEHDGRRYIAVALAKSRHGEQWLQKLIVALDEVVCQTETTQN